METGVLCVTTVLPGVVSIGSPFVVFGASVSDESAVVPGVYDRQCKAMDDYESALRERIRIDAEAANLKVDIHDPDDE